MFLSKGGELDPQVEKDLYPRPVKLVLLNDNWVHYENNGLLHEEDKEKYSLPWLNPVCGSLGRSNDGKYKVVVAMTTVCWIVHILDTGTTVLGMSKSNFNCHTEILEI